METVLLVIHLMLVVALIAVVLLQRSEGGALGIGGGGNFMAARSTGNVLTRTTTILAGLFFVTSIGLTILARNTGDGGDIFENLPANALPADAGATPAGGGVLDLLGGGPATETPAVPDEAGAATPATPEGAVPVVPNEAGGATPAPEGAAPAADPPADPVTPAPETPPPAAPASL